MGEDTFSWGVASILLGLSFVSAIIPLCLFLMFNKKSKEQQVFSFSKWYFLAFTIYSVLFCIWGTTYAVRSYIDILTVDESGGWLFIYYFFFYPFIFIIGWTLATVADVKFATRKFTPTELPETSSTNEK